MNYTHILFNGKKIALNQFKHFIVTGILRNNKRFKPRQYSDFDYANGINLYNGSIWGVLPNNKRVLLKRVYN